MSQTIVIALIVIAVLVVGLVIFFVSQKPTDTPTDKQETKPSTADRLAIIKNSIIPMLSESQSRYIYSGPDTLRTDLSEVDLAFATPNSAELLTVSTSVEKSIVLFNTITQKIASISAKEQEINNMTSAMSATPEAIFQAKLELNTMKLELMVDINSYKNLVSSIQLPDGELINESLVRLQLANDAINKILNSIEAEILKRQQYFEEVRDNNSNINTTINNTITELRLLSGEYPEAKDLVLQIETAIKKQQDDYLSSQKDYIDSIKALVSTLSQTASLIDQELSASQPLLTNINNLKSEIIANNAVVNSLPVVIDDTYITQVVSNILSVLESLLETATFEISPFITSDSPVASQSVSINSELTTKFYDLVTMVETSLANISSIEITLPSAVSIDEGLFDTRPIQEDISKYNELTLVSTDDPDYQTLFSEGIVSLIKAKALVLEKLNTCNSILGNLATIINDIKLLKRNIDTEIDIVNIMISQINLKLTEYNSIYNLEKESVYQTNEYSTLIYIISYCNTILALPVTIPSNLKYKLETTRDLAQKSVNYLTTMYDKFDPRGINVDAIPLSFSRIHQMKQTLEQASNSTQLAYDNLSNFINMLDSFKATIDQYSNNVQETIVQKYNNLYSTPGIEPIVTNFKNQIESLY
jgi:hypothetical protein